MVKAKHYEAWHSSFSISLCQQYNTTTIHYIQSRTRNVSSHASRNLHWQTGLCCLHLKMEFCSCARGRQWCGIIHYHWWTASIRPRLLFSRAGYASWGLSLSSVWYYRPPPARKTSGSDRHWDINIRLSEFTKPRSAGNHLYQYSVT